MLEAPLVKWGLLGAAAVLVGTSTFSIVGLKNEHIRADELAVTNQELRNSLTDVRGQLQAVTTKLDALSEARKAPATTAPAAATAAQRTATARPATDPRIKQVQDRVSAQQKQLDSTQKDLATARQDLDSTRQDLVSARDELQKANQELGGRLDTTRDELNGSIARNHDELVALQKRGERNYYEFTIDKAKQFHRVGPISLSARKVDFKRKYFDLALMVDDQQLEKKHVDLFEPVMIRLNDRPQPLELVVNEIRKDQIKGYVSEPKYKNSELAQK